MWVWVCGVGVCVCGLKADDSLMVEGGGFAALGAYVWVGGCVGVSFLFNPIPSTRHRLCVCLCVSVCVAVVGWVGVWGGGE